MENKKYDLFVNILDNPDLSYNDFIIGGMDTNNTSLKSKEEYQKSQEVQDKFKTPEGAFDQKTFDRAYNIALLFYNQMATTSYMDASRNQARYFRDNIFADPNQKNNRPEFKDIETYNPYQIKSGISELQKDSQRELSIDELAQQNKVLLNPKEVKEDLSNAQWGDSPNGNWFKYFDDTLVLAQYDTDGEHIDPFSGKRVQHSAGDLKTDADGNFYYEKLDGRKVYNRRVLNKLNTLTVDGSFWNKFDFFDSDDLQQKGLISNTLKNAALVGSMFIPYVGPVITGISIATQMAGVGAVLGKMLAGSDNEFLSNLEGWSQSVNRQTAKTEYAQNNMWCWENMINLIGDVFGQLKEQRFIFDKIPAVIKGSNMSSKVAQEAKLAKLKETHSRIAKERVDQLIKDPSKTKDFIRSINNIKASEEAAAVREFQNFVKSYNKLGKYVSMGYMTGITVKDTYGEAKNAGATDLEATMLTLGYAAAEFGLLNTGLGEWVMPELRAGRYRNEAIARAVLRLRNAEQQNAWEAGKKTLSALSTKEGKKEYVKELFNIGKNIARAEYANGSKTLKATSAAALGEAFEETSEEFLADFSKGCFNVVEWLRGKDTRMTSFGYDPRKDSWNYNDLIDRYGMSFIGGLVGGGLANMAINYRMINSIGNMTNQQAYEELVYMIRNKEIDGFLKSVDKMQLGDKNLSATDPMDFNGNLIYAPGTKENNQDKFIKDAVRMQVKLVQDILEANGAVSDDVFLDKQTLSDLRFGALQKSTTAGAFLQEFNTLNSEVVRLTTAINTILDSEKDTNNDGTVTDWESRKGKLSQESKGKVEKLEQELKETQNKLKDLMDGKRSTEFISTALFEMSYLSQLFKVPNFISYAETLSGKKFNELSNDTKEELRKSYEVFKTTEGRDQLSLMSKIYLDIAQKSSKVIQEQGDSYNNISERLDQVIKAFNVINTIPYADDEKFQEAMQSVASGDFYNQYLAEVLDPVTAENFNKDLAALRELQISAEEKEKKFKSLFEKAIYRDIYYHTDDIKKIIEESQFMPLTIKNQLKQGIANMVKYLQNQNFAIYDIQDYGSSDTELTIVDENALTNEDNQFNQEIPSTIANAIQELNGLHKVIDELPESPIEKDIDQFSISIGEGSLNVSELITQLESKIKDTSDDISKFMIDENLYKTLNTAIQTIELYKAAVLGARTDAASLNDFFGYNATINEVSAKNREATSLAEIDSKLADQMVQDIDSNLNRLKALKRLYQINRSQKLSLQSRIGHKRDILLFKNMKTWASHLSKLGGWKDAVKLSEAINSAQLHLEFSQKENASLSSEQEEKFMKEQIAIEDAFNEFYENNKENFKSKEKLAELIDPNVLSLYVEPDTVIDDSTTGLDDNGFVWWMTSKFAVKSSEFYKMYKGVIDPEDANPIAPIPTQEQQLFLNYANVVKGNVFTQIYDAYTYAIKSDWRKRSVDDRKHILKTLGVAEKLAEDKFVDYCLNFLPSPKYPNIVLSDGIPGSGKSNAVTAVLIKILDKYHKNLLNDVVYAHGASSKSAEDAFNSLNLKGKHYGREELMKYVNSTWKPFQKDANGKYTIDNYVYDSENMVRSAEKTAEVSSPPSLIIIDEISHFTSYDLDQINEFARKYGITVLVSGDFDQAGSDCQHSLVMAQETFDWAASLESVNLIRGWKMGVSMRTDNSIKTQNLQKLRNYIHNPNTPIALDFYEDETGIYGDELLTYSLASETINQQDKNDVISRLEPRLKKLIETLKPGQKIGYVYSSDASPIFQLLSKDEYKSKIDFYKGMTAQGKEGQYYIVDIDPYDSGGSSTAAKLSGYFKDIYTGISRAEQGCLFIAPNENQIVPEVKFSFNQLGSKIDESYSKQAIQNYSRKRKALFDKILEGDPTLSYTPRDKYASQQTTTPPKQGGLDGGLTAEDSNQGGTPPSTQGEPSSQEGQSTSSSENSSDSDDSSQPEGAQQDETPPPPTPPSSRQSSTQDEGLLPPTPPNQDQESDDGAPKSDPEIPIMGGTAPSVDLHTETDLTPIIPDTLPQDTYLEKLNVENKYKSEGATAQDVDNVIQLHMLFHTFSTFEIGGYLDEQGNFSSERGDKRIDSLNGLLKMSIAEGRTIPYLINVLGRIRSILKNTKDNAEAGEQLSRILGIDVKSVRFAYKKTAIMSQELQGKKKVFADKPSKFDKAWDEKILFNQSTDDRSSQRPDATIVALISDSKGEILEIPLITLNSPLTLIKLKDGEGNYIFDELLRYYNANSEEGVRIHNGVEALIAKYGNSVKYKNLINLFKLYNRSDNFIYYFSEQWNPNKDLSLFGPEFVVEKGDLQDADGFDFNFESLTSLSDISANPELAMTPVLVSLDGQYGVKKGHPFVLISYDTSLDTAQSIAEQYMKQQNDKNEKRKVIKAYVLPPKASIKEYLDNINNIIAGSSRKTEIKSIGNLLTSYNLLDTLFKDDRFLEQLQNVFNEDSANKIKSKVAELRGLSPSERLTQLTQPTNGAEYGINNATNVKLAGIFDMILLFTAKRAPLGSKQQKTRIVDLEFDTEYLSTMETILGNHRIDGVYYHVKIPQNAPNAGAFKITDHSDSSNYEIDGKPFQVHGKIDSYVYTGSLDAIIEEWLKGEPHNGKYMQSSRDTDKEIVLKYIKNQFENKLDPTTYNDLVQNISSSDNQLTKIQLYQKVAEFLQSKGQLAFMYEGKLTVFPISKDSRKPDQPNAYLTDPDLSGNYTIQGTFNGKHGEFTINLKTMQCEFTEDVKPDQKTDQETNQGIIEVNLDILNKDPELTTYVLDNTFGYDFIYDGAIFDNHIVDKCIDQFPGITDIQEWYEEDVKGLSKEEKDIADELMKIFRYIDQSNQTNNSCSPTVKFV